jgi:hypothetical protein
MRRSVFLTLAALGGLVSLIGGIGLFAALTDTATTGQNSADSGALAASADIQLATAILGANGEIQCGQFSENLATGFFTLSDVQPGEQSPRELFCIKNAGSQQVALTVDVFELTDVETGCTGDEETFDNTCGAPNVGELSQALFATFFSFTTCFDGNQANSGNSLKALEATPLPIGYDGALYGSPLAAGATGCFAVRLAHGGDSDASQRAQSDSVTWRFRFNAQVPAGG